RLLMPLGRIAWPQRTFIRDVRPGSVRLPRGEDLNVQVQFAGRPPSKAWIDTTVGAGALNTRRMTALKDGSFLTALGPVADNVTYRVRGGDAVSETYSVEALERIRIQDRKLTYTYRPYTRLVEKVSVGAGGTFRAPVGTRIAVRATTNKPIASLTVTLGDDNASTFLRRLGPTEIGGELTLAKAGPGRPTSYTVHLTDRDGLTNLGGETCAIQVEEDRPPGVRIEKPVERNLVVTPGALVPVGIVCEDSYGLQDGMLDTHVTRGGERVLTDRRELFRADVPFGRNSETNAFDWDLTGLHLNVGDTVTYQAKARDFCDVDGPNVGTSQACTLRVVSVEDFIADVQRRQSELVLGELERAKELQEKNLVLGEELAAALARDKTLSTRDLSRLLAAGITQKDVTRRAGRARTWAAELRTALVNNRLGDTVLARQLKTAGDTLDAMASGVLPEAEADLGAARTSDDAKRPEKLARAVDTQKQVKKDLSDLVDRLRQWQSLSRLRQRAQVLLKKQQDLNRGTLEVYRRVFGREPKPDDTEQLVQYGVVQRELKGELTGLLEDMAKSAARLAERAPDQAERVAHARDEAKRADIETTMLTAAAHLGEVLLGRATEEQERAERGLEELVRNLSEADERERARRDLARKLRDVAKALDRALAREKNILDGTQGGSSLGEMLRRIEKALTDVRGIRAGQSGTTSKTAEAMQAAAAERQRTLDRLAAEQRDLEKRTETVGKDVGDIARDAPRTTPQEATDALGGAKTSLAQAQGRMGGAASSMKQAGAGQPAAAGQPGAAQQQASKNLDDAERKLQDARAKLEDTLRRELDRLRREQDDNRKLADSIRRELDKLNKENPSGKLANASRSTGQAGHNMQNASNQLAQSAGQSDGQSGGQSGAMQDARQQEQEAIENLDQARRNVADQQDEFEERDREEQLLEIETELRAMLQVQLPINSTTEELDVTLAAGRELSRKEKLDLKRATDDERSVSERSVEVQTRLEEARIPVFTWVMGEVAKDTNAITSRLSRSDTGVVTRKMEATVAATLKDLIDALQRARHERQQQGGGGGGGGGGGPQRMVPPLAELKMIRTMHKRVSGETGDFDALVQQGRTDTNAVKTRVRDLADKERHIGKLLKDLLDALQEPPEEPAP
ncbi:MAG TPA: DUF4175 family protein, partial [Planctomycetota bacterium]|nr:DUF4175 family protein [Planctomycetota bacterium]